MKKLYLLTLLILVFTPCAVFAQPYSFITSSKVEFEINDNDWKEAELSQEREYIIKKWQNNCGTLMYGHNDAYSTLSDDDKSGLSREEWNSSLIDNDFAQSFVEGYKENYSVTNWKITDLNLKFIEITGTMNYSGLDFDYYTFSTMNNGYLLFFQYFGDTTSDCLYKVNDVVESAKSNILIENSEDMDGGMEMEGTLLIIINLILTMICYMAYPLIRLKINKGRFIPKQAKRIALWNAIIVGGIFLVISSVNGQTWTGGAAFLYYWINEAILTDKNKKDIKTDKNIKSKDKEIDGKELKTEKSDIDDNMQYMKDNKNFKDLLSDINDRKEISSDVKNNSNNHSNLDEIKKLKELLDMDAISKEEYEEKKKELLKK